MFTLLIGGSASGKSDLAEGMVCRLPGPRLYIATMQAFDDECRARIARHRARRAGKGFSTVESPLAAQLAGVPAGANALLECLSNLVANEMYDPAGQGPEAALAGVLALAARADRVAEVVCGLPNWLKGGPA